MTTTAKPDPRGTQLELFDPDVLFERPCTVCRSLIRTVRIGGSIKSEYTDAQGRCWQCAKA